MLPRRRPPRRRVLFRARTRILAAFVVLLAASTVLSTIALREVLLARADERVDADMVQEVAELRRLIRDGRDPRNGRPFHGDLQAIFDAALRNNVPGEGEVLYTFAGARPYRSSAARPQEPALVATIRTLGAVPATRRGTAGGGDAAVAYLAVPVTIDGKHRGTYVVTEAIGRERAEVAGDLRVAAGIALGVLALASALAWLVAGRVLAPLRALRDTAGDIAAAEDLTRRIAVEGDDEIAELARTFNGMLDRLDRAFAVQRDFVSDAGHELRTPITIIRGHLELLGDDPRERRETIALVTDELDRMSRFVDDLLTLARSERADFLHPGDVDVDELAEELLSKARGLADRDWRLRAATPGRVVADRQRLTQAVMNLARNAVEHTGPGDVIELGGGLRDGSARLWVRDTGPGVPAAERDRIFERFARGGGAARRSDGAGLGLAIVRAIAEAHGGHVELESAPGAGATFTIVLPA